MKTTRLWEQTRDDLNGGHGACGPSDPSFPASERRHVGNKKAKSDKNGAASAMFVEASIDKCLAKVTTMSKQNASTFTNSWSSLKSKHDETLAMEKEKVVVKKERLDAEKEKAQTVIMQTDTTRIKAMSQASQSISPKDERGLQDLDH